MIVAVFECASSIDDDKSWWCAQINIMGLMTMMALRQILKKANPRYQGYHPNKRKRGRLISTSSFRVLSCWFSAFGLLERSNVKIKGKQLSNSKHRCLFAREWLVCYKRRCSNVSLRAFCLFFSISDHIMHDWLNRYGERPLREASWIVCSVF